MNHLDLFSGIGGFALAAERAGFTTTAFAEIDPYACGVLRKNFPFTPNLGDVRGINHHERTTVVTAGFPCQPFSLIGKQLGLGDPRNLWGEVSRILSIVQPPWFIGENVPQFANVALDEVWDDLESKGYEVQPFLIPACGVDARHKRERLWILGYSHHAGSQGHAGDEPDFGGWEEPGGPAGETGLSPGWGSRWPAEPLLGRVANGIPHRVDRLKALGNSIVPQVAERLFRLIRSVEQGLQSGPL